MGMKPNELKKAYQGIILQPPTPFKAGSLEIDEAAYRKHIRFLLDSYFKNWKMSDGLIHACGICGEWDTLTLNERKQVFDLTIEEVKGKVPVIATIDSTNVRESIELAKYAEKIGMDGVLAGPPFFDPPMEDEIITFFKMISDAVGLGIIVYDTLYATQVEITVPMLERLIKEVPHFAGFQESVSVVGLTKFEAKLALKDQIAIVNGAAWQEPITSFLGSRGYLGYIYEMFLPKEALALRDAIKAKDWEKGMKQRERMKKMVGFMYLGNGRGDHISRTKLGCEMLGIHSSATLRPPKADPVSSEREEMKKILKELGY
jgi:4-hydroxy-tetrahydrodipicolinate synthase